MSFRSVPGDPAFDSMAMTVHSGNLSIRLTFTDIAGKTTFLVRFDVYREQGTDYGWIVRQVHFEDPETGEAFAGSGPVA